MLPAWHLARCSMEPCMPAMGLHAAERAVGGELFNVPKEIWSQRKQKQKQS